MRDARDGRVAQDPADRAPGSVTWNSSATQTHDDGSAVIFQDFGINNRLNLRPVERRFNLADHVKVVAARLDNGLLHIELEREIPEAMKPKQIPISSGAELLETKEDVKAA